MSVVGSKENLKAFKDFAYLKEDRDGEANVLSTEKFIPFPEGVGRYQLLIARKEEGKDLTEQETKELMILSLNGDVKDFDWHSWCIANWGTKWGICHAQIESETARSINYYFDSAWSPPIPVFLKMAQMFPELKFTLRYYETGMGYKGTMVVKGTEVLKDEYDNNYHGHRGG